MQRSPIHGNSGQEQADLDAQIQRERQVREHGGPQAYVEATFTHLQARGGFRLLCRDQHGGLGILGRLSRRAHANARAFLFEERPLAAEERARLAVEVGRLYLARLAERGLDDAELRLLIATIEDDYRHIF